jgi:hypothetical protein
MIQQGLGIHMPTKEILDQYLPADKILKVNDRDDSLIPIDIPLPECPPIETIDGYGLPAKEQKFKRQVIPLALVKIIKSCDNTDEIWDRIYGSYTELSEELAWIKKQWYYRIHGYWFFNNGKPTWITGQHFFYLNYTPIDVGLPKYRDRSRKHFICMWYFESYHYDFKNITYDKLGNRLPNKYGDELEDVERRTVLGLVYPKQRRAGATYESLAWVLERIIRHLQSHSGIQGPDKTHGYRAFKKLIRMWRKIPFFFSPLYEGNNDPDTALNFVKKTTGKINAEQGLESVVTYATTNDGLYYDQEKLLDYLREEPGKTVLSNIYMDWDQIRQTMGQGAMTELAGFALFPSTVGEMEKKGGENYFYLCRDSNYYIRTKSGTTKTGLVLVFFPADEGLEGYIDEYGESIIWDPTPEQAKFTHKKKGAHQHLLDEREHYLRENTPEAIEKYQEQQRLFPLCLKECFTSMGGRVGYNEIILDKRIAELRFDENVTVRGNFEWSDGFGSKVVFMENPMGRWVVSELLPEDKTNLKFIEDGHWKPLYPSSYMHASDPFNFDETEGKRQSKGGGIAIKRRNKKDPDYDPDQDIKKWKTPDVSATYSYRHADTDKYCEDMLKQNLYYGGKMNCEVNNEMVRKYYIKHGYRAFLYFYYDTDGKRRKTAGFNLNDKTGDAILGSSIDYIERHGHRCNHLELLLQCKELKGRKDITNCDLVAVHGSATNAIENDYRADEKDDAEVVEWNLDSWKKKA